MTSPVLPGAEPFSAAGADPSAPGALVLHGFTGTPQSMRGLALAFAGAGFATELPLLPGHGTSVADMAATDWSDWSAAAEAAYLDLAARTSKVVVAGLSMGATLAIWLAERHPDIAGVVSINGAIAAGPDIDGVRDGLNLILDDGTVFMPGPGNDIADPDQKELAYDEAPVAAMASLLDALVDIEANAAKITCPLLLMVAPQDHVVPPLSTDLLAAAVQVPVTRVELARSYHVATLDYDKDLIERESVAFARRVTTVNV
jgi:carboxylesterase